MKILLQDIPKEGLTLNYEERPDALGMSASSFAEPIRVDLSVLLQGGDVFVQGRIRTEEILPCSRCLVEAHSPVCVDFHTAYIPLTQAPREEELQLRREDLDLIFYEADRIELSDLVRSQILLARPMRPLCKRDCRGLCPQCGQDLNVGSCACDLQPQDPRFSVLMKVKHAMERR